MIASEFARRKKSEGKAQDEPASTEDLRHAKSLEKNFLQLSSALSLFHRNSINGEKSIRSYQLPHIKQVYISVVIIGEFSDDNQPARGFGSRQGPSGEHGLDFGFGVKGEVGAH